MKFATKPIKHYPPHLRHVATLPLEIKKSFFVPMSAKPEVELIFYQYHYGKIDLMSNISNTEKDTMMDSKEAR